MDTFEQEALPHLTAIQAFALHLTGDGDDAADLVQNTFYKALRYWSTYRVGSNCKRWLFRICHNEFLRERMRHRRRPDHPSPRPEALQMATHTAFSSRPFPDPGTHTVNLLQRESLGAALQSLPECYRRPLRLFLMEELPYRDISDELGVPLGTVKSRIHRGRERLRDALWPSGARRGSRRDVREGTAATLLD